MTSSSDLIAGIPSYMAEHLSLSILGRDSDAANLVNSLNDPSRINRLYDSLTGDDKFLLRDIFLSGGEIDWVVFSRIYKDDINKARDILVRLGAMGLVFQGGLTGRDPIIMLPSLSARIQEDIEKVPDTQISWKEGPVPEIWKHKIGRAHV